MFIRQAQVRWTQPLTDSVTLSVAAENPEFLGAASGADNGLDAVPDFTVALKGKHSLLAGGTFHLGSVIRYLDVDNSATQDFLQILQLVTASLLVLLLVLLKAQKLVFKVVTVTVTVVTSSSVAQLLLLVMPVNSTHFAKLVFWVGSNTNGLTIFSQT